MLQWRSEAAVPSSHIEPSASLSLTDSDDDCGVHFVDEMPQTHQVLDMSHADEHTKLASESTVYPSAAVVWFQT